VNRTSFAFGLLAVVAALAIAGCGGGSSSTSETGGGAGGGKGESASNSYGGRGGAYGGGESNESKPASSEAGGDEGAVVSLASSPKLGMILVDSEGMTLYDFHKDRGTTSSCYAACAEGWPPLTTEGEPQVGNGASGSKLGTTERKDGTMQVTYAGHPLYTFVGDKKPGEANGNDIKAFGASWYALKGSGEVAGD
jgi:predicted lipoprotein with Yx(FWY)xxD motif